MSEYLQVMTTTATEQQAQEIAAALVDQRRAACAQVIGPLTSVYRWQGKVEQASEWLCTIKTRQSMFPAVESAIRQLHDYDCPEIIAMPIVGGSADYLHWLGEQLAD